MRKVYPEYAHLLSWYSIICIVVVFSGGEVPTGVHIVFEDGASSETHVVITPRHDESGLSLDAIENEEDDEHRFLQ